MHRRMFEIAKDYFEKTGLYEVVGGIISPTHDEYGKAGLVSASHRCAMIKLATRSSSWIRLSDWEVQQNQWSRTRQVLQHHKNFMNNYIKSADTRNEADLPDWVPKKFNECKNGVKMEKKTKSSNWRNGEISTLLDIMLDKHVMELFDDKKSRSNDIYKMVSEEMKLREFNIIFKRARTSYQAVVTNLTADLKKNIAAETKKTIYALEKLQDDKNFQREMQKQDQEFLKELFGNLDIASRNVGAPTYLVYSGS